MEWLIWVVLIWGVVLIDRYFEQDDRPDDVFDWQSGAITPNEMRRKGGQNPPVPLTNPPPPPSGSGGQALIDYAKRIIELERKRGYAPPASTAPPKAANYVKNYGIVPADQWKED